MKCKREATLTNHGPFNDVRKLSATDNESPDVAVVAKTGGEEGRVEIGPTTCSSAASKRKAFPVDCRARYPHGGQRFQHVLHHDARPTQIDVSFGNI